MKHIEDFLQFLAASRSANTISAYRFALLDFFTNHYHGDPEKVTQREVGAWIHYVREVRRLAPGSIIIRLASINQFMRWTAGTLTIRVPKAVEFERPVFTEAQYEKIIEVCRSGEFRPFWLDACIIAWNTGMRMSDISLLPKTAVNCEVLTVYPKKRSSVGQCLKIPMVPVLKETCHRLKEESLGAYLMPWMAGTYQMYRRRLVDEFRAICDAAGLPEHSFHCFRHTFVSRLLNNGVDPLVIGSMTGQSLETMRRYSHISLEAKRKALGATGSSHTEIVVGQ